MESIGVGSLTIIILTGFLRARADAATLSTLAS